MYGGQALEDEWISDPFGLLHFLCDLHSDIVVGYRGDVRVAQSTCACQGLP